MQVRTNYAVDGSPDAVFFIGTGLQIFSTSLFLLAILPSDAIAITTANSLLLIEMGSLTVSLVTIAFLVSLQGKVNQNEIVVWLLALSAMSSIQFSRLVASRTLGHRVRLEQLWRINSQGLVVMGVLTFGGVASGILVGARNDIERNVSSLALFLIAQGVIFGVPNFRAKAQALLSSSGEMRLVGAGIAAAISSSSIEDTSAKAAHYLRYITLDMVAKEDLMGNKPNASLYTRSRHGKFGQVDAFISHSWSDPSEEKWDALQRWRRNFKISAGREPRVWFDKFCIDQLDIDTSLMCLPVHLAACDKFLILAGPTYLSRMWCAMELFTFVAVINDPLRLECVALKSSPQESTSDAQKAIVDAFRGFSVGQCECRGEGLREKLLTIIEAGCGTLDRFDSLIRSLPISFLSKVGKERLRSLSTKLPSAIQISSESSPFSSPTPAILSGQTDSTRLGPFSSRNSFASKSYEKSVDSRADASLSSVPSLERPSQDIENQDDDPLSTRV
jgi:hypothetical protein